MKYSRLNRAFPLITLLTVAALCLVAFGAIAKQTLACRVAGKTSTA